MYVINVINNLIWIGFDRIEGSFKGKKKRSLRNKQKKLLIVR